MSLLHEGVRMPERDIGHECGLVGIVLPSPTHDIYASLSDGLTAVQNRGIGGAGIAYTVGPGGGFGHHNDIGKVDAVFPVGSFDGYPNATAAIGHTRYATSKSDDVYNLQPAVMERFAMAHNGNINNISHFSTESAKYSDSYQLAFRINNSSEHSLEKAIIESIQILNGAYSLLFLAEEGIYVVTDPWGMKPLCGARKKNGGYVVASETVALQAMGADMSSIFWFEPGGLWHVSEFGPAKLWTDHRSVPMSEKYVPPARCYFEETYFARAASESRSRPGISHDTVRLKLGQLVGSRIKEKVQGTKVVAIPDSGLTYAQGIANALGLKTDNCIQPNKDVGRTFIAPASYDGRLHAANMKYYPIWDRLKGEKIILVDDSIVKGPTTKRLVRSLLDGGVAHIDLVIGMPPIKNQCSWGVDFADPKQLIYNVLMESDLEGTFEERLKHWLCDNDELLMAKLNIFFQDFDEYKEFAGPGSCLYCFGDTLPKGLIVGERDDERSFIA